MHRLPHASQPRGGGFAFQAARSGSNRVQRYQDFEGDLKSLGRKAVRVRPPPSAPNELLKEAEAWCRFNLYALRHDPERQRSRRTGNRDPAGSGPLVSCDATLASPLPDYRPPPPPVGREQTLPHVGVISALVGEPARRRRGRAGAATGTISTGRSSPAQR